MVNIDTESLKKDLDDIKYTISLIGDGCDDLKRTEAIKKTDELLKKLESINLDLRKDAAENARFKSGDKVVVTVTNSKEKPTVCFVNYSYVDRHGNLTYNFKKCKKDGTQSEMGIRFYTGWNGGQILIEPYKE